MTSDNNIAQTIEPPYYAVIFTSIRQTMEDDTYQLMAQKMVDLAAEQPGFLGIESAHEEVGITVSYWRDLESIKQWKNHTKHQVAQRLGIKQWYRCYKLRIAKVERDYGFNL